MAIERTLPGGRVLFSTRLGGVSSGPYASLNLGLSTDDDDERVRENSRRLVARAGLERGRVAMGRQVHGAEIREWTGPPGWPPAGPSDGGCGLDEVDGHATALPALGLLVLVADCVPLALVAPGRVAMLHCGWRGLAAGIVERALETFDEPPAAAIGPGIGGCCYEVGEEVLRAFAGLDGVANGRMLDLKAVVRRKLAARAVSSIDDVGLCTSCRGDLFFSHRRDRGITGRQAGIAWLERAQPAADA